MHSLGLLGIRPRKGKRKKFLLTWERRASSSCFASCSSSCSSSWRCTLRCTFDYSCLVTFPGKFVAVVTKHLESHKKRAMTDSHICMHPSTWSLEGGVSTTQVFFERQTLKTQLVGRTEVSVVVVMSLSWNGCRLLLLVCVLDDSFDRLCLSDCSLLLNLVHHLSTFSSLLYSVSSNSSILFPFGSTAPQLCSKS